MIRRPRRSTRSTCPISIALEMLGDTWSLLIVRDLLFKGFRTFNEFLGSDEGIASNILSDRLAGLEAAGIVSKELDTVDQRRYRYRLTEKGLDLAPTLIEITLWSARHEKTGAPEMVLREMTTNRKRFIAAVRRRHAHC